jgi:hypothetical protein
VLAPSYRSLDELGLAPKALQYLELNEPDLLVRHAESASTLIAEVWHRVESKSLKNNLRGKIFEGLISVVLVRRGLTPYVQQAELAFIPETRYDFLLWHEGVGPIVLSAKVSLRERIKQAALEALALKQVHRRARVHVITLSSAEAAKANKRVQSGDYWALDGVVVASSAGFDELLDGLGALRLSLPRAVPVVRRATRTVT